MRSCSTVYPTKLLVFEEDGHLLLIYLLLFLFHYLFNFYKIIDIPSTLFFHTISNWIFKVSVEENPWTCISGFQDCLHNPLRLHITKVTLVSINVERVACCHVRNVRPLVVAHQGTSCHRANHSVCHCWEWNGRCICGHLSLVQVVLVEGCCHC